MIPALSAPALRATSHIPSPLAHLTPFTYLDQGSTFLLVLPLCLCFSLTTPLCVSFFHSLGLAQFPYHSSSFSLLTSLSTSPQASGYLFCACSPVQEHRELLSLSLCLSVSLSLSLSLSLSSCYAPGPDQNGGESPIQQLLILTFAKAMLAECGQPDIYRWWPSHDPKAAGGLAASLSWKEKRAHRVQSP